MCIELCLGYFYVIVFPRPLRADLKKNLINPDNLFRRVRNKLNKLVPSIPMSQYHPGRGVYRSSYKNAMRLARTEINIAYRKADSDYWKQSDLVLGIRIETSNNHPVDDICDELAGEYPKNFIFTGWHPQCRCHAVPIIPTAEQMSNYLKSRSSVNEEDEDSYEFEGKITELPEGFTDWVKNNERRIDVMRKMNWLPYFIRDNAQSIDDILNPKQRGITILEKAKLRHEARTKEQEDAIRKAWDKRRKYTDPMQKNNEELESALGIVKGNSMSFDEANELRGNPHYSEDRAYRVNCQTCVVANELRRRGFDVEALPNIKGSKLEMLSHHTEMAWIDEIGNVPKSHIAGGAYNPRVSNTGRVIYSYKTGSQMMNEFDAMTQDAGRYHVKWHWKKKQSGHIITFERRTDGSYLFYDPQTGKKGTSLMPWNTKEIDTKKGLRVLRVDNLRVNPQLAKDVLTKPTIAVKNEKAATSSITGRVTPEIIQLRRDALQSGKFILSPTHQRHDNLITSQLYLGKKPLERIINHCVSADEIDAVRYIWQHPDSMRNPCISPLGAGKDMTSERAKKNIEKKRKRGVEEYIEYEFEYAGQMWSIKTEHHRAGFEQFYHIRKK